MHTKYGMPRFAMENQIAVLGDPYRYPTDVTPTTASILVTYN